MHRLLAGHRLLVLGVVLAAVVAAAGYAAGIRFDMSFRPTFSTDAELVDAATAHQERFGEIGLRDLVAIVEVDDLHDRHELLALADLSARLEALDYVSGVRDPTAVPMFDRAGAVVPASLRGADGELLDGAALTDRVDDMITSRQLRRLVLGDDLGHVAITASVDLPNDDFEGRRPVVREFDRVVDQWSAETGMTSRVTGYPYVEQVYAHQITVSVLVVISVLYAVMIAVLYAYFRRWRDTLVTLSGVTVAVPLVLAEMRLLGQPFSIVNSQVLTLVVIVGVAHALHHVEEYRRRRERGAEHAVASRAAFTAVAFPSLMTGVTTVAGFIALCTAGMPAVASFGLCTAAGVATVYVLNWLVVTVLLDATHRRAAPRPRPTLVARSTERLLHGVADLVERRPWRVVGAFVVLLAALAALGIPRVSVNQRVNEELPAGHEALTTQQLYEEQFSGFLGPELWLRPADGGGDVLTSSSAMAALVTDICALPDVRFVASPLDLVPQAPLGRGDDPCPRTDGAVAAVRPLVDAAPSQLRPVVHALLGSSAGDDATLVIRLRDIGTAHTLPFVQRVEQLAERHLGTAVTAEPVGEWWLAQNGIDRLSVDVGFAAFSALAIILPLILLSIRERRLFLASILPTVMPVVAALAFMGLVGIPLRIGTAMILAISLGLAADDTVYLSTQVRRRIAAGNDPASALHATLRRTGRPAFYSSIVLIAGFASMTASSLVALRDMGIVAAFTMAYALATDIVLGPAIYRLMLSPLSPLRPAAWATAGGLPCPAPAT